MLPVNWLDHSKTLREQGIDLNETLLLRRKFFFSDQNVDARDPVQLNLLYVQVRITLSRRLACCCHLSHVLCVLVIHLSMSIVVVCVVCTFSTGKVHFGSVEI